MVRFSQFITEQVGMEDTIQALVARGWRYDGIQKGMDGKPHSYNFTSPSHGGTMAILPGTTPERALLRASEVDASFSGKQR